MWFHSSLYDIAVEKKKVIVIYSFGRCKERKKKKNKQNNKIKKLRNDKEIVVEKSLYYHHVIETRLYKRVS